MMYPLKFAPVYKSIIWGGRNIKRYFKRDMTDEKVAESWEVCSRDDGMSVVANGQYRGRELQSLIDEFGEKLLSGPVARRFGREFPLLIKIIDANDQLSVQVHPDDAYAQRCGERNGKNEMWYIIDAKPDAQLVYGLKEGVTKERFAQAVQDGTVESTLNRVDVKPGDALFIPAGTVHAILGGILIAEIQQNSNTTYRIYDWGRVDKNGKSRELHIDKALDVIRFDRPAQMTRGPILEENGRFKLREVLRSDFFNVDEVTVKESYEGKTDGSGFKILMPIKGGGTMAYDGGRMDVRAGETLLIPACLGRYRFDGETTMLEVYM